MAGTRKSFTSGLQQRSDNGGGGNGEGTSSRRPHADGAFEELLDKYKHGNWGSRFHFLPTVSNSDSSEITVARMRMLVECGNTSGVKILLHSAASPNIVVDVTNRRTPLHLAVQNNDIAMCQLLLRFHADPDMADGSQDGPRNDAMGWTARDLATSNELLPLVELFRRGSQDLDEPAGCVHLQRRFQLDLRVNERGFMGERGRSPSEDERT
eukprot:TRINITY_DN24292_c0_g1_i1.p2 TRINITY_DN24292_c0_g1~~TRINITY_DN24292_c0_g1_i1.p2  ORF type:complete len:211 (+),score=27.37 TRINITY_DN24292_c0_g1_i1:57-689(+)